MVPCDNKDLLFGVIGVSGVGSTVSRCDLDLLSAISSLTVLAWVRIASWVPSGEIDRRRRSMTTCSPTACCSRSYDRLGRKVVVGVGDDTGLRAMRAASSPR